MSLIIATGSNLKNKLENLNIAKDILQEKFEFIAQSEIFESEAVDFAAQPDFYNQVLEFKIPNIDKDQVMKTLLDIELSMGRVRNIDKGPRTIDLDILFWGTAEYKSELLTLPHPRWQDRSFVVRPLQQLPFFQTLEKCFKIPHTFDVEAKPIKGK
jgi:2-amino-4-hydroxy-6-hydroxymethyldihydropteridine diphosphokinase